MGRETADQNRCKIKTNRISQTDNQQPSNFKFQIKIFNRYGCGPILSSDLALEKLSTAAIGHPLDRYHCLAYPSGLDPTLNKGVEWIPPQPNTVMPQKPNNWLNR
jgi:hypothetical protein